LSKFIRVMYHRKSGPKFALFLQLYNNCRK
jgi:hypothetical protein